MKTLISLVSLIFFFTFVVQSQELKLMDEDDNKAFKTFNAGDYITLNLNENTQIWGEISKFGDNIIILKNYSKEEEIGEFEGNSVLTSKIDELSLNIMDIESIHSFNKIRNAAPYTIIAGVLAFFLAPAISVNYSDFSSFNSNRYFKTTLLGLGLITVGITINFCFKNKAYININGNNYEEAFVYGSKNLDAVFSIR